MQLHGLSLHRDGPDHLGLWRNAAWLHVLSSCAVLCTKLHPTTWTVLHHAGSNHLGLWLNAAAEKERYESGHGVKVTAAKLLLCCRFALDSVGGVGMRSRAGAFILPLSPLFLPLPAPSVLLRFCPLSSLPPLPPLCTPVVGQHDDRRRCVGCRALQAAGGQMRVIFKRKTPEAAAVSIERSRGGLCCDDPRSQRLMVVAAARTDPSHVNTPHAAHQALEAFV